MEGGEEIYGILMSAGSKTERRHKTVTLGKLLLGKIILAPVSVFKWQPFPLINVQKDKIRVSANLNLLQLNSVFLPTNNMVKIILLVEGFNGGVFNVLYFVYKLSM